ncbi:MAG: hypothetical protein ACYCXW_18335, partial [Solirubrobacteraceae bacterium]
CAAGFDLPGTILVSVGLCLIVVVASLAVSHENSAPLATPAVLVLTVAGYVLRWRRALAIRPEGWALAVALGVFAVCAAPVVLSGNATFLGYFVLNDGVFHFSLITQLFSHGPDLSRLPLSTYSAELHNYLATSYPTGSDVPIGVLRPLVGQDVAWLFQPYQAVIMAIGATALFELLRDVIASRPLRALTAFIAGQGALLYAYYLEASIKEVVTVWLITLTVVLVFVTLRRLRLRAVIPLALVTWAGIDVLNLAIAPWTAPPVAAFVLAAGWQLRHAVRRFPRRQLVAGGVASVVVIGGVGTLLVQRAQTFLAVAQAVLTQPGDFGNLAGPLPKWEMFGIWPVGDFRFPVVSDARLTYALIGVECVGICIGLAWAVRRRKYAPLLLFAGITVAVVYLLSRANPYAAGKVEMIASLTAVASAMLGAAALLDYGHRIEAWALATVIAGGVLWSTALGYHDASVAPRARLQELASIDQRFKGQGPAFYNLSDEYADYFLRNLAPTDVALGAPAARTPAATPPGRQPWDPDALSLSTIESYRLLVIGNPALASRPPANFRLAYQGRYYDVWQRTSTPTVLEHVPLGGPLYPGARPSCALVRRTAARARAEHARLAYVVRPPVPALIPTQAAHPPNWGEIGGDPFSLITRQQAGVLVQRVSVPVSGNYEMLAAGAISQKLTFIVDGHRVGALSYDLGPPGQITPVGSIHLTAGRHWVAVVRPGVNLLPGDGGTERTIGPVLLLHGPAVPPVFETAPSNYRSLCGRYLDWLEVVR